MVATGSVSDFPEEKLTDIESRTATALGIDASRVTVTVEAASVLLTTTITADTKADAEALETSYKAKVGEDADAVGSALDVAVEEDPTFNLLTDDDEDSSGCAGGCVGGVIGGISGCTLAVFGGLYYVRKKKKNGASLDKHASKVSVRITGTGSVPPSAV